MPHFRATALPRDRLGRVGMIAGDQQDSHPRAVATADCVGDLFPKRGIQRQKAFQYERLFQRFILGRRVGDSR